ncbi:hypothetical protein Sgly_2751 [Syntrophobotulus glycolicus DSM 8271]|uniref:Peptidase C39-like domain-containing protein n=1 Tax=Syntrophobotulus glycolicus (strain DSM 8271 / FlGlyR) TaxID=645991 RepID=F0SXW2_SYNGF|nr:C39 family peptidase [Syntrophobotulus glycolicus]ADY57023.1 hypothetical protein Sgly_2751 [Syntrophobotulus glycolicus DSM 8271]
MNYPKKINVLTKIMLILFLLMIGFNTALQFFLTIKGTGISILDIYAQSLPQKDTKEIEYTDTYFVETKSYFEKQERGQCAGFSSAYVLRTFGEEISGRENYRQLNHKFSNGYVMPQALIEIFNQYGHHAEMLHGDLKHLKTRLNEGNPIIVLIGHFTSWQHYVTVVGYDEENIFLYDSNMDTDHTNGYNRTMTNTEFLSQWENEIPLFEQIYFVVSE